jgi:hypothetical protein
MLVTVFSSSAGTALSCKEVKSERGFKLLVLIPSINPDTSLQGEVSEIVTLANLPPKGRLLEENGIAYKVQLWKAPERQATGRWHKRLFLLREKDRVKGPRKWKLTYQDGGDEADRPSGVILIENVDHICAALQRDRSGFSGRSDVLEPLLEIRMREGRVYRLKSAKPELRAQVMELQGFLDALENFAYDQMESGNCCTIKTSFESLLELTDPSPVKRRLKIEHDGTLLKQRSGYHQLFEAKRYFVLSARACFKLGSLCQLGACSRMLTPARDPFLRRHAHERQVPSTILPGHQSSHAFSVPGTRPGFLPDLVRVGEGFRAASVQESASLRMAHRGCRQR